MKIIFAAISFFIIFSFNIFAKDCKIVIDLQNDFIGPTGNAPCVHKVYWSTGNLNVITNWVNRKEHGEWRDYYENGQLRTIGNYKNGKKNGKQKSYYANGKLKSIAIYEDGGFKHFLK